jgi:hypothetical protein
MGASNSGEQARKAFFRVVGTVVGIGAGSHRAGECDPSPFPGRGHRLPHRVPGRHIHPVISAVRPGRAPS